MLLRLVDSINTFLIFETLVLDVYPKVIYDQRKLRNIYWFRLRILSRRAKPWYTDGLIIQSFEELGDRVGIFLRLDLIFTLLYGYYSEDFIGQFYWSL